MTDNFLETAGILLDPETMDALRESDEQEARGEVISWEAVKKELGL